MPANDSDKFQFQKARRMIQSASALWIGAGAGMGVDSGLPDFRGNEGFWNAYPPYRKLGYSFYDLANPRWFYEHPRQAWGFYGHRLNLYRQTVPHRGFEILRQWARRQRDDYFVFTSNVDGHFQKSGFCESRIVECHGCIHWFQCTDQSCSQVWSAPPEPISIDHETMLAEGELPRCRACRQIARPNILMFGDFQWIGGRTDAQERRMAQWLNSVDDGLVKLEFGAGTAVPTVRYMAERLPGRLIRINPRESHGVPGDGLAFDCGALEFIQRIDQSNG